MQFNRNFNCFMSYQYITLIYVLLYFLNICNNPVARYNKSVSFRAKNIEKYYLIKYIGFTITHFRDFLIEQFLLKLLIINVYLIKSTFIIIIWITRGNSICNLITCFKVHKKKKIPHWKYPNGFCLKVRIKPVWFCR